MAERHEDRSVVAETGLEIEFEAEEAKVVLLGFGLIKYPEDGNGCVQDRHL